MNRNAMIGLGALVLVVVVLAVLVFGSGAGGAADAARAFFAAIPSGGPQAAYAKASPAFRSATTADAWSATVAQHDLSQYASSNWDNAGKGGDVVTLNGVLILKTGGAQPASVRLVKASGGWSVFSLDLPSGGVAGATTTGGDSAAPGPAGLTDANAGPAAPTGASTGAPPPAVAESGPVAPTGAPPPGPQPGLGAAAPGGGPVLVAGRISHDCGPHLLRTPGVRSIDVHCVDSIAAAPGARGQCQALVNGGEPARVSVVVRSYDLARDDAELDCRLF